MSLHLSMLPDSAFEVSRDVRSLIVSVNSTFDPTIRFRRAIGEPDPWQSEFLVATDEFILALCSRQVGKSTAVSCTAWDALTKGQFVLIVGPSERQCRELHRKVLDFMNADAFAPKVIRSTQTELELSNGGRLISVPSSSDTIRGYTVDLLIFEEAAFMSDELISAVLPMRTKNGRVLMISTPAGKRGIFFDLWTNSKHVRKIHALSLNIPRLADKVAFDLRHMPKIRFDQEHRCLFLGDGVPFMNIDAIHFSEGEPLCLT